MKLTMKDQYEFQIAEGYGDDPDPMDGDDIRAQLEYWKDVIEEAVEDRRVNSDLAFLGNFLGTLIDRTQIEYTDPHKKFGFRGAIEYATDIYVLSKDEKEAERIAIEKFKRLADEMPPNIEGFGIGYVYLECDENSGRAWQRIFEE